MAEILTQTLGYPRIGADRELKKALEGHWKGKVEADELLETFRAVQKQSAEGPVGGRHRPNRRWRWHLIRPRPGLDDPTGIHPRSLQDLRGA